MSIEARVNETAEAICSALYRTGWGFLGETDGGRGTWFSRGEKPAIVRAEIERLHKLGRVDVILEYPNLSDPRQVVKGRVQLSVDVTQPYAQVELATETCVVRCLEVFRDVLAGTGVAGPLTVKPGERPELKG